ncbi:MAG TPA: NAD(P)/FAD-dependent oxidoreductase [Candidatus Lokiarchaeia archaeon]|nr:NAD(P)/FAD-dependent oxidoreductase [Candidatus Lokiarchaeia archaeon]
MKYDVAIIGAGIAGTTAAQLASKDFETIIIDAGERGEYRPSSGVFPDHNNYGFDSVPDDIFARDHLTSLYLGMHEKGIISGPEFDRRLGKILYLPKYLDYAIADAEQHSCNFLFNTTAQEIRITPDGVAISCVGHDRAEWQEIQSDVVLIATGSNDFRFHKRLGFQTPRVTQAIQAEFQKDEDQLAEWEGEYTFHLNAKISKNGPFWVTRRKGEFDIGYIDKIVNREKFDAILTQYKPIQPLLQNAQPLAVQGKQGHVFITNIASDPLRDIVQDRIMLLGDAAGLVTPFYYEGAGEGRYSALYAVECLKRLRENQQTPTKKNLLPYQQRVHRDLNGKLYKSGLASAALFYGHANVDLIFSTYIKIVNQFRDVREKIVYAYYNNPANYKFSNDTDVGKKMFDNLPLSKKLTLTPLFLKASLK